MEHLILTCVAIKVRCWPYNGVFNPLQNNKKVYNLFKGYNPAIKAVNVEKEKQEKYMKPFFDLGTEIFEGNREDAWTSTWK